MSTGQGTGQSTGPSTGQIHDLGYKRYLGSRSAVGTRWTVIMRHQIASAWKGWWRFKLWLIGAVMATAIAAGFLYLASGTLFRMMKGMGGQVIKFADGILPLSTLWYCKFGFLVSLTIGAMLVAGDVGSGAFTFYFARSVRPRDYVIGKLAGIGILMSLIMLAGPFVLAALRLGLSDDFDQLIELLPIVYKALAIGLVGTLIYTAIPLGFSALFTNKWLALGLWAAYYVVFGTMAAGLGLVTHSSVSVLDLPSALQAVSFALFDLHLNGPRDTASLGPALISILGQSAIAIGLVFWRVRQAQQTGVGGSS